MRLGRLLQFLSGLLGLLQCVLLVLVGLVYFLVLHLNALDLLRSNFVDAVRNLLDSPDVFLLALHQLVILRIEVFSRGLPC